MYELGTPLRRVTIARRSQHLNTGWTGTAQAAVAGVVPRGDDSVVTLDLQQRRGFVDLGCDDNGEFRCTSWRFLWLFKWLFKFV